MVWVLFKQKNCVGEDADLDLEGLQERSLGCVHCDGQADGLEAHEVVSWTPWYCLLEN